jgi:drug/metabolite transporter (DMT)-like permease
MRNCTPLKTLHFSALLVGTIALSLAPIFVRMSESSASAVAFWRMALSTPFLAFAWWLLPAPKQMCATPRVKDYFILSLVGVAFGLDLLAFNASVQLTTIANATLLVNFASLFVALFSWYFLRESPSRSLIIGMFIAIMGCILLVWPHFSQGMGSLLGDSLGLLAAMFYGLYLLCVQIVRQSFSTMTVMTITGVITALTALGMGYALEETLSVASSSGWAALWGSAIVVQMIGQGLIAYALVALPVTLSSVVLLLQPVLSAIMAVWLFDESLEYIQILGMLVVLTGIVYAKYNANHKKETEEGAL